GKHMGSNRKPARRNSRQPDPAICPGLPCFRQLGEIHGNGISYVDIVGVTGSIPVAPTILCNLFMTTPTKARLTGSMSEAQDRISLPAFAGTPIRSEEHTSELQ